MYGLSGTLLAAALLTLGAARAGAAQPGSPATARLTCERTAVAPGETAHLGIVFDIEPGWHLYWEGRSESGMAPVISLTLPDGWTAGEVQWPAPKRHVSPGEILDHIHEDRLTLIIPLEVPADARPGAAATIAADLEWLVCKEVCLAGAARVTLSLPIAEAGAGAASRDAPLFEEARARHPRPLPARAGDVRIEWDGLTLRIAAPGTDYLAFYPLSECLRQEDPIADNESKGGRLAIRFMPVREHEEPRKAHGVLELRRPGARPVFYEVDLEPGRTAPAPHPESDAPGIR